MMLTASLPDGQEVNKRCPKCAIPRKLVVRTNRQNGSQFLSCPNWPKCNHTEQIPESLKMQLLGQPTLL